MLRLKVWTQDKIRKFAINFRETDSLEIVIKNGCRKHGINGVQMVAEEEGTFLADEEDLLYYTANGKPVLLLPRNEKWIPISIEELSTSNNPLDNTFQNLENTVNTENLNYEQLEIDDPMSANEPQTPQLDEPQMDNGDLNNQNGQPKDTELQRNLKLYLEDKKDSFRS